MIENGQRVISSVWDSLKDNNEKVYTAQMGHQLEEKIKQVHILLGLAY